MNEFRMLLTKDPQFPIIRLDLSTSISDRPLSRFFEIGVYNRCIFCLIVGTLKWQQYDKKVSQGNLARFVLKKRQTQNYYHVFTGNNK